MSSTTIFLRLAKDIDRARTAANSGLAFFGRGPADCPREETHTAEEADEPGDFFGAAACEWRQAADELCLRLLEEGRPKDAQYLRRILDAGWNPWQWTAEQEADAITRLLDYLPVLERELQSQLVDATDERNSPGTKRQRRKRRRRKSGAAPRPLTAKQTEAAQIVGECKGNLAEAARRLGIDRKTLQERYEGALSKLGRQAVKHRVQSLPLDRRGQERLSCDDDRRG
jgi:predicted DNA-binding protein (UPF0251 family)